MADGMKKRTVSIYTRNVVFAGNMGFTLIELMIALVLSVMVSTGIYQAFESQNKSYIVQERAVEMQQSLRSAMIIMEKDIRMACFDPKQTGNFSITGAASDSLAFSTDNDLDVTQDPTDGNGIIDSGESFTYELYPLTDPDPSKLHRMTGRSAIAYNVDELRFAYAYDADGDGSIDTATAGGEIVWAVPNGGTWFNLDTNNDGRIDTNDTAGGSDTLTTVDPSDIRAVKVWVLVRSSEEDSKYTNPNTYVLGNIHYSPGDHYRRKLGTATIKLRNAGL